MKKILSSCVIAAAFVALPASAQWYVGVGVGSSKLSGANGTDSTATTYSGGDASKSSFKVYGGYQLTPTWGVEAQYTDLGSRNITATQGGIVVGSGNLKASQYSLAAVGTLPLASNFAVIGKLGVSRNTLSGLISQQKSDLLVGVGVSYAINSKLAVRLEYEDFGKLSSNGGANGGSIRANNLSLNLQYAF